VPRLVYWSTARHEDDGERNPVSEGAGHEQVQPEPQRPRGEYPFVEEEYGKLGRGIGPKPRDRSR
jgi:hypothetical protein